MQFTFMYDNTDGREIDGAGTLCRIFSKLNSGSNAAWFPSRYPLQIAAQRKRRRHRAFPYMGRVLLMTMRHNQFYKCPVMWRPAERQNACANPGANTCKDFNTRTPAHAHP